MKHPPPAVSISTVVAALAIAVVAACGGSSAIPASQPARASGQSAVMGSTFAGQHACDPKTHDRPFIIEWDATDASSFESRASTDIVFVRYEGCNLQVIDTCTNDSVRGSFGSYLPIDWTSGAVEKIDVANEAELYAKLPLGAGSLGGRVRAGEKFHMEYFVSGTRKATRPFVYKGEIDKLPGCRGVTHAVYAFNLGAFALASASSLGGEAGGSIGSAGAGGSSSTARNAEKKGGDLSSCRAESAKETATCQAPIRLTLREIQDGDNPDAVAAVAPETPDAMNLAGKLQANNDREREAVEHLNAAQAKVAAGDGLGCLRELDAHDRTDPRPAGLSTSPKGFSAYLRVRCLMVSGRCDSGKSLEKRRLEATSAPGTSPEALDAQLDGSVMMYCAGTDAQPRDQLLHAMYFLGNSQQRATAQSCKAAYGTWKRVAPTMTRDDPSAYIKNSWRSVESDAPRCLARAGDCASAWTMHKEAAALMTAHEGFTMSDESVREDFTSHTRELCVGKAQGALTPREELFRASADLDFSRSMPMDAATCRASYEKGRAVVFLAPFDKSADEVKSAASHLEEHALSCLARAQDCPTAWRVFGEMYKWRYKDATDRRVREAFDSESASYKCHYKPQGALTPRERLFFSSNLLDRASDADKATCQASYREVKTLLSQLKTGAKDEDLERVESNLPRGAPFCLVRAHACDEARAVYHTEERARVARRPNTSPPDDATLDRDFDRNYAACRP